MTYLLTYVIDIFDLSSCVGEICVTMPLFAWTRWSRPPWLVLVMCSMCHVVISTLSTGSCCLFGDSLCGVSTFCQPVYMTVSWWWMYKCTWRCHGGDCTSVHDGVDSTSVHDGVMVLAVQMYMTVSWWWLYKCTWRRHGVDFTSVHDGVTVLTVQVYMVMSWWWLYKCTWRCHGVDYKCTWRCHGVDYKCTWRCHGVNSTSVHGGVTVVTLQV